MEKFNQPPPPAPSSPLRLVPRNSQVPSIHHEAANEEQETELSELQIALKESLIKMEGKLNVLERRAIRRKGFKGKMRGKIIELVAENTLLIDSLRSLSEREVYYSATNIYEKNLHLADELSVELPKTFGKFVEKVVQEKGAGKLFENIRLVSEALILGEAKSAEPDDFKTEDIRLLIATEVQRVLGEEFNEAKVDEVLKACVKENPKTIYDKVVVTMNGFNSRSRRITRERSVINKGEMVSSERVERRRAIIALMGPEQFGLRVIN